MEDAKVRLQVELASLGRNDGLIVVRRELKKLRVFEHLTPRVVDPQGVPCALGGLRH
jgi:hypothetical protein